MKKAMDILAGMGIAACGLVDLDYAFVRGGPGSLHRKGPPVQVGGAELVSCQSCFTRHGP